MNRHAIKIWNCKEIYNGMYDCHFMFDVGVSMISLVGDYNNWGASDIMKFILEIKNESYLKIIK